MSKISVKTFTCPSCGCNGEFKMYDSVNVSLDPKLRDKVLSGEIFDWTCPKCGEVVSLRHNLLYHDMKREFQIYYSPTECDSINEMINDMLTKYPGMRKTCRTVDSLNALREKIYIYEEGLNDIAIELSKAVIKYDKKNNISPECELRFEKQISKGEDSPKGLLIFRQIIEGQPQKGMLLFDKTNYDNLLKEVLSDVKFKIYQFCDTIDEQWILNRMTS
jgi:predicted RNA-binding Zn-ribbon protein involved in translation (DUF1610 family)